MDVAQLERELHRVKGLVDSWALSKQAESRDIKDQHAVNMKEKTEKLSNLKASQQDLITAVELLHKRLAQEESQVASLESAASTVHSEEEAASRQLAALQEALHAQQVECLKQESDAMLIQRLKDKRIRDFQLMYQLYSSRLGLQIKDDAQGGQVHLIMTQIDPHDPSREFEIAVQIMHDDTYEVTECRPEVPGLLDLLDDLNAEVITFARFIAGVRRGFQAVALASSTSL